MGEVEVSRRAVRHELIRRRNERIAELRDDRWPLMLYMHPRTLDELLMDPDPAEASVIDFEGREFMRIPLVGDPALEPGVFRLQWPEEVDLDERKETAGG
jgi:hypothetical protein